MRKPTEATPSAETSGDISTKKSSRSKSASAANRETLWTMHAHIQTAGRLSVGKTLRLIPRGAWICGLVACLNAVCWSIITPPFQVPDETSHFAYVQELAETQRLPQSGAFTYTPAENIVLRDLRVLQVRWHPEVRTISSQKEQRHLQKDLALPTSRHGEGGVGVAYTQPPLYYALETIPYKLGSGGSLLDQLELMRLLSTLMAGLTAFFIFLFLRETLPSTQWAWTVGGLSTALLPTLGLMSGAVNPDAMLFAVSAAIFYFLARAFRRGLTPTLTTVIGALTAIGFLTKLNFIGLAPGVVLGLVVLSFHASRTRGRAAFRSLAIGLAIAASPVCLYVLVNLLSNHPGLGLASSAINILHTQGTVLSGASYIWQFYLPRLPGMTNYFPGLLTTRQLWFDRSIGLYGWLDTSFPAWVENIALIPVGLIVALCLRALIINRTIVHQRIYELVTYILICVGLMLLTGIDAYVTRSTEGAAYVQLRYLLPLLPLLATVISLAARGVGRRLGPTVGILIVLLFLAYDIFSQLLVVSRFYA
jgi:hypothetical protein